jgi:signal transduction histidine kinase
MRTPLQVMSGYATALSMMGDLTDVQREYADNILIGVERMVGLIDNLLDLGRIEAGVDLHFQDIDIDGMLHGLAEEHWLYAHQAGVTLRVEVESGLPRVPADRS